MNKYECWLLEDVDQVKSQWMPGDTPRHAAVSYANLLWRSGSFPFNVVTRDDNGSILFVKVEVELQVQPLFTGKIDNQQTPINNKLYDQLVEKIKSISSENKKIQENLLSENKKLQERLKVAEAVIRALPECEDCDALATTDNTDPYGRNRELLCDKHYAHRGLIRCYPDAIYAEELRDWLKLIGDL